MSKPDEDTPNFDNLDDLMMPSGDADLFESVPDLPADELPADELIADELPADEMPTDDGEPMADVEAVPDVASEESGEEPLEDAPAKKKVAFGEWAIVGGVAALLLVLGVIGLFNPSTSVLLIAVGLVGYEMWRERERINIYTVLLGCALILVLTGIYCMWTELGRYNFQIRAKQQASVSASDHGIAADRRTTVV